MFCVDDRSLALAHTADLYAGVTCWIAVSDPDHSPPLQAFPFPQTPPALAKPIG